MKPITLKVITLEDVETIFKNRTDMIFDIVIDAFKKYINGDVLLPDKISQIFDNSTQNRINCMPATLFSEAVSGLKWVSVFPTNATVGEPNVTGVMLLSEIKTGFPIALIDGTLCTKIRTAAVGCVAAKYLAPSKVKKVGFIGAGEEARMHCVLLKHLFPTINTCRVASRKHSTEIDFVNELSRCMKDVSFIDCEGDYSKAVEDTDIIVTAISAQAPLLKANAINKGCLYIHVGGWEDEYAVAQKASKIVCDDWEASKHRTQTISRMYKEGLLTDDDIYANLNEIIQGSKLGRENDEEIIYFNSVGLSFIDINFANEIYKQAQEMHLGRMVTLAGLNDTDYSIFL
mgnify:CR=1 FL=1